MFNEIVAHYDDLIAEIGDTIAYTVTIPDCGMLTLEEAVRRMGFDAAVLHGPGQPHSVGSLSLHQVGTGIATLDWTMTPERQQVIDRLGGRGIPALAGVLRHGVQHRDVCPLRGRGGLG